MVNLVLFDLDGVLIDAKQIHYEALNKALGDDYAISENEHLSIYDGRPTRQKLQLLTLNKNLPTSLYDEIYDQKQKITIELFRKIKSNQQLIKLFEELYYQGYKIGVCSNSIRQTVLTALAKLQLIEYCSVILSNEDVKNAKPHPEMYWKAMSIMGMLPEDTLIVEDSPPGLLAAERSRARYIRVASPSEVTTDLIFSNLEGKQMQRTWKDDKLNVLIPMAGAGSRFQQAGYTFPKPLIDVNGKPMIQLVCENLGLDANYIFVVQKEHREKYNLDTVLNMIKPNCTIVETDGVTEGAACTTLLAKEYINNSNPLFFANSDQFVQWNPAEFMYCMQERGVDGGMLTFKATHPKWSFAKVDMNGYVAEVAEKNPISDIATVGFYYWKQGSDYVKYAEQMIANNIRFNNEFYVCPVFNQAIADGKKFITYDADKMWGLGTPEDLMYFLQYYKEGE